MSKDKAESYMRSRQEPMEDTEVRRHGPRDCEVVADSAETADDIQERDGAVFGKDRDFYHFMFG